MKTLVCNNYIYGNIKRRFSMSIINDMKKDAHHHELTIDDSNTTLMYFLHQFNFYKNI